MNQVLLHTDPIWHPPNSQLFGPLKDLLPGCHFVADDKLKHGVREELRHFSKQFYTTSIQHLMQRWKMCVDDGDFVEK
jgi:hypothetical protein